MNRHPLTFIEKITAQIKEEHCRYRNALSNGKEFFELQQIKNTIQKLETTLQQLMNSLQQYVPKSNPPLTEA
jgi:tetrahydromethanopterin S-methyltransferase subunit B